MSSKKNRPKFVSCFKLHGVPLLPPILSEEQKRECRLYRKEAMLLEKERELKKKEEELERLRAFYESSSNHSSSQRQDLPEDSDGWTLDMLCFMINAILRESSTLEEFKLMFHEITQEFKRELKSRGLLKGRNSPERSTSRNCDSTCHDVENITLNQNHEQHSSIESIAQDSTCFERESGKNSVIFTNDEICLSERSQERVSDPEDLPCKHSSNNISTHSQNVSTPNDVYSYKTSLASTPNGFGNTPAEEFENDGMQTPPRLIRSNSYTLESPSPSVLAYLRNLTLGDSSERVPDVDGSVRSQHDSGSKSVVRNLNNHWSDPQAEQPTSRTPPHDNDALLHVANFLLESDDNRNVALYEDENLAGWRLGNESTKNQPVEIEPSNSSTVQDSKELQKTRAATVIQAAARGFLVRRLMKTQRVETIKNTIKDAIVCAWELYEANNVTPSDVLLHERIMQQVAAACYELRSIFLLWSTAEKMALIKSDRERLRNPKPKFRLSRGNSESESSSSSRSTSRSRATVISSRTDKGTKKEMKRPTTLPNVPKTTVSNFKPWSC